MTPQQILLYLQILTILEKLDFVIGLVQFLNNINFTIVINYVFYSICK